MAWVVKSWEASPKPNEKGEYVRIVGRQEGLVSWFLSLVGIDPTIQMVVTDKNFRLEKRSLFGHTRRTIPISRICEIKDGFEYPWLTPFIFCFISLLPTLFFMFWALFEGEISVAFGRLFLAIIFFGIAYLIYRFNRYLIVGVTSFGGSGKDSWGTDRAAVIEFKPSFIEGQKIDVDSAERVGIIIQALLDRKS